MTKLHYTALAALMLAPFVTAEPAHAGEPTSDYVLSIVYDRAHGDLVQRGDYQRAIRRAGSVEARFPYSAHTNQCVAHVMLEQYDEAFGHCETAVQLAEQAAETGRRKDRDYLGEWSMALTNRGVLHARSGDIEAAEADFREALALGADTAVPEINLAQLGLAQPGSLAKN